jgi:hypothetical protein
MIDYIKLHNLLTPAEQREYLVSALRDMTPADIKLSDLIVNSAKRAAVLVLLAEKDARDRQALRTPWMWTIQVLRDEWGNIPQPGEKLVRTLPVNRVTEIGPVGASTLNAAMIDGSYAELYEDRREYEIDKKGCVSVPFEDAMYFLMTHGYNTATRRAICNKPEYSTEPCETPAGGKLHIHYWRYAEVSPDAYQKLPDRVDTAAKRGK